MLGLPPAAPRGLVGNKARMQPRPPVQTPCGGKGGLLFKPKLGNRLNET